VKCLIFLPKQCIITEMTEGEAMLKIAASILSADFSRLGAQVAAAQAGGADYIHCDVMYISQFAQAGASNITVHTETCPHLHRTIQQIRESGVQASVTINPATPLCALDEILPYVDMVLLMTVNPGFGGQSFIESMLAKIRRLREMIQARDLDVDIEVDGGINIHTVRQVVEAGANVLVAGSAIFAPHDGLVQDREIAEAITELRRAASR
jgi:ribulose-phosphate 3-epimerase